MQVRGTVVQWVLSMLGALVGGALGYLVFVWLARQGFYGLILPGAAMGLGCAALSKTRSNARGIVCGVLAVPVGLLSEWRSAPFVADQSLGFFLGHLHHLQPITIIFIVLGAVFAYWFSAGARSPQQP